MISFFCVHGGISPHAETLDPIYDLDRFKEPPRSGVFTDLLWSDPAEDFCSDGPESGFLPNKQRSTSVTYGYNAVSKFLVENCFLSIIRAHECQDDGYRMYEKNEETGFPSVISLFSAPMYAGHDNDAAILCYKDNAITIKKFVHQEHPYYLPSFENAFQWSLPFVSMKVGEFLLSIMKSVISVKEDSKLDIQEETNQNLKFKISVVSKFLSNVQVMKEKKKKNYFFLLFCQIHQVNYQK